MATVELVLSNPRKRSDRLPLQIEVVDSAFARKWVGALRELIKLNLFLKKDFCFLGFIDAPEPMAYWCKRLERHIAKINAYRAPGVWASGYRIKEKLDPNRIFRKGKYDPGPMFRIHHHFELLIGQEWKMSPYFLEAKNEIRHSILQLNDSCHQIEWLGRCLQQAAVSPESATPCTMFSVIVPTKFPFAKADLKEFKIDAGNFGAVYLKYGQIGKNHWEAFLEGDTEIFDSNINALRHFSGQFTIDWGQGLNPRALRQKKKEFMKWLAARGLRKKIPELALGRIKVGQVKLDPFEGMSIPERHKLLSRYLNIESIKIIDGADVVKRKYPYHFRESDYEEKQMRKLKIDGKITSAVNTFSGIQLKA